MGSVWLVLGGLSGWVLSLPAFSPWPLRATVDYALLLVPYAMCLGAVAALVAAVADLRRVAIALAFAPGTYTGLVLVWFFVKAIAHLS